LFALVIKKKKSVQFPKFSSKDDVPKPISQFMFVVTCFMMF